MSNVVGRNRDETKAELAESDRVNRSMRKKLVSDRGDIKLGGRRIVGKSSMRCSFFSFFLPFFFFFAPFTVRSYRSYPNVPHPSRIYAVRNFLSLPHSSIEISFQRRTLHKRGTLLIFENCLLKELVSRSKLRDGKRNTKEFNFQCKQQWWDARKKLLAWNSVYAEIECYAIHRVKWSANRDGVEGTINFRLIIINSVLFLPILLVNFKEITRVHAKYYRRVHLRSKVSSLAGYLERFTNAALERWRSYVGRISNRGRPTSKSYRYIFYIHRMEIRK